MTSWHDIKSLQSIDNEDFKVNPSMPLAGLCSTTNSHSAPFLFCICGVCCCGQGLEESRAYVQSLIDAEVKSGTPSNRIVLGGFSQVFLTSSSLACNSSLSVGGHSSAFFCCDRSLQGAALTLYTGLQCPHKLAGLVVLSGYLPYKGDFGMQQPMTAPVCCNTGTCL